MNIGGIDANATTVSIIALGTLGIGTLLSLLIQALKDFWPTLDGRKALGAVYMLSLLVAALVVSQSHADAGDWETWVAILFAGLSIAEIAKGVYARIYNREAVVRAVAKLGLPTPATVAAAASSAAVSAVADALVNPPVVAVTMQTPTEAVAHAVAANLWTGQRLESPVRSNQAATAPAATMGVPVPHAGTQSFVEASGDHTDADTGRGAPPAGG